MRNGSGEKPETITYEQAVYDADLLARTLKVGYGAYYVFGEETFDKAHADMMAWLNGKTSISVSEFDAALQKNYYFMRDAHASVAPVQEDIDGIRRDDCWTYFYCEDAYQQDENGCLLLELKLFECCFRFDFWMLSGYYHLTDKQENTP